MNRRTFFARLASARPTPESSLGRRDTKLVGLEPLEDRKMLTTSPVFINDNWTNLNGPTLEIGDFVQSAAPDGLIVTAEYGFDGFGTVGGSSIAGAALIDDAIFNTDSGGTLNILAGTYAESDIVVDKPITIRGATGPNTSLIVPEVVSSHANAQDFGVGTHSGIIIYSPSVTIENLKLDGNGNGSLAGTLNFHHGITTLFALQNGGNYSTTRGDLLAPSNMGGDDAETNITVRDVTVTNTWWHGITLSGLSGTNIAQNSIFNATVSNIGQAGSRDLNRIGILLQNQDVGQVIGSTVTNAGVGIASGVLGPNSFGNNDASRNKTGMRLNTVTDADQRAYSVSLLDTSIDIEFLLLPDTPFVGFNANKAIYTNPANNAVGLFIHHSQAVVIGYESTNAKIGVLVENTTVDGLLAPIFAAATIVGPGSGVAGSVGILADNAGDVLHAATFGIAGTTKITGFQTGIRSVQSTPTVEQNYMLIDRPLLSGNGTAISIGNNSVMQGNANTGDGVVTTGTGTLSLGFPESFFIDEGPGDLAGPYSDNANTGNATFSSSGTFDALITGQTGSTPLFTFNEELGDFPLGLIPPAPDAGRTTDPYGSNFGIGNLNQSGGQLKLQNSAMNGPLSLAYNTLNHPDPNDPGWFILDPVDISDYSHLNIVVKLGTGNQASAFIFGLADTEGHIALYTFPTEGLSTATYTTVSINLAAPGVPLSLGEDSNFDLTQVMGWALIGDLGLANGALNVPLRLTFEEVVATSVLNSKLNVTGTVNLGGTNLDVDLDFTPSISQQFIVIDNDGVDAVVGTFNGVPNNTNKVIDGKLWRVNYNGGTGNDVVLTFLGDAPTNSTIVDRHIFYNQSAWDGNSAAISAALDNAAIATDKDPYIPNGTTAVPINITSFSRGINGIMVDLSAGGNHAAITASDFIFKVGANNTPSSWAAAAAPSALSVIPGGGVGGSDRVIITWAPGVIKNQWLEVQVKANANTGLAATDVHFWGNKIGDSGTSPLAGSFQTNATDAAQVFANVGAGKPITDLRDFNRDKSVNATDAAVVFSNVGLLNRLNVPAIGPFAPEAEPAVDGGGSAVASALAAPKGISGLPKVPGWITSRLASVDLNSGKVAELFTKLAEVNTPGTRSLLLAANEFTDSLDLDDSLLESLIAGLN